MQNRLQSLLPLLLRCALIASIAALLAVSASAAAAQTRLTPHSATYKIKISVVTGELKTTLEATDDGLKATHEVRPTGMSRMLARGFIRESSEFHAASDGIRATRYTAEDTLSREPDNVDLRFDWEAGEVSGTVNGEEFRSTMETLSHDRISIQYQLMFDLLNGVGEAQYTMFEIDRLRQVHVRNIGTKTVKVPAGEFVAVGVQHQAEGSKRVTTLWCAEELGYLPVIIEQHRQGTLKVRATLSNYEPASGR